MTKIKYDVNGQIIEIEVNDSFATTYVEIESEDKKAEERLKWHKRKNLTALDAIEEMGGQIADPEAEFVERISKADEMERALSILTREQRELIQKVYYENYSLAEITREKNCSKVAVTKQKQRALAQLKKYFENL